MKKDFTLNGTNNGSYFETELSDLNHSSEMGALKDSMVSRSKVMGPIIEEIIPRLKDAFSIRIGIPDDGVNVKFSR